MKVTIISCAGRALFLVVALFFSLLALTISRAASAQEVPGQTLDSLIEIARRLSPDLAARNLDAAAAEARVTQAGSLPDPTITLNSDEIDRTGGARQGKLYYGFSQEIPLWGKRSLREGVARAEVNKSRASIKQTQAELIEKVSTIYAEYYHARQAIALLKDLHKTTHDIAAQARARYAQGRGGQQEIFKAEVDASAIAQEQNRFQTASQRSLGLLNTLLDRDPNATLAEPQALPALPSPEKLSIATLLERAQSGSPAILAATAEISGAEQERILARKNWYPDLTLNAYGIDRGDNGPPGYSASINFKVPLQWGMHQAQESEATAKLGASQARQNAAMRDLREGLIDAVTALEGAERNEEILHKQVVPNAEAAFASARSAYGLDRTELATVLIAQHDLARARLDLLAAQVEQHKQLAIIERLIGDRL